MGGRKSIFITGAAVQWLRDGLKLIAARARLMQELPRNGLMAAVFADRAQVAEELQVHRHIDEDAQRDAAVSGNPLDRADARETAGDVARFEAVIADLDRRTTLARQQIEELIHANLLTVAVADEQNEAFSLLPNAKSKGFATAELEPELALLNTMADSTERLSRRVEMRAENLIRRQSDHKQGLLNRRLGLLTIISAIFMPLTLLAGIWGMNFENMPELDDPYAYPAALSFMGLLALIGGWRRDTRELVQGGSHVEQPDAFLRLTNEFLNASHATA